MNGRIQLGSDKRPKSKTASRHPSNQMPSFIRQPITMNSWLLSTAVPTIVLYLWLHKEQFTAPIYWGDAAYRIFHGDQIIVRMGNRIWLPWLQFHVLPFYHYSAPLTWYGVIPLFYAVVFVVSFSLLWKKSTSADWTQLLLCNFVLLCMFAGPLGAHYASLHQESPMLGIGYLCIYLFFYSRRRWPFLLALTAGLLTRENFWVYYAVMLGAVSLNAERRSSWMPLLLAPGAVILVWLGGTGQGLLPHTNSPENLSLTDLLDNILNLARAAHHADSIPLILSVVILLVVSVISQCRHESQFTPTIMKALPFSFVSLILLYSYVLLADPWQATPVNVRILGPFFEQLPLLLMLLTTQRKHLSVFEKTFQLFLLSLTLLWSIQWQNLPRRRPPRQIYTEQKIIAQLDKYSAERRQTALIFFKDMSPLYAIDKYIPIMLYREVRFGEFPDSAKPLMIALRTATPISDYSSLGTYRRAHIYLADEE